ncbi:MAG: hypothetical protein GEU90_08215 [Gemmatimonas sp.]|nr:hypothetical protein [Gemmatimonas sp.]
MKWMPLPRVSFVALLAMMATGCGPTPVPQPTPAPPPEYVAMPDTLVCVVDRATPVGLTHLPAKVGSQGIVVYSEGAIRPLEEIHPVNMIAGYAGQEEWVARGDPIPFSNARYVRIGGERRVDLDLLARVGEHLGILLFAGREDPATEALYIPTTPGCIFQAYVREDLIEP